MAVAFSMAPPPDRVDVLVLTAHAPDLAGLRTALTERIDGIVRGIHIVGRTVGVGMPVAGAATALRISKYEPRAVIFLGPAGVYPGLPAYRPLDVIAASRFKLVDAGVLAGRAAFPDPMQAEADAHPLLTAGLAAIHPRTHTSAVASTLASTTDPQLGAQIATASQTEAENLELYAVALACLAAQVPFAAVLGVTHLVGPTAREDWQRYHRPAVTAAAETVLGWAQNGAQGLPHG